MVTASPKSKDRMQTTHYFWNYLPLLLQILFAVAMGAAMVTGSFFIGKHRRTISKLETYECGIVAEGDARGRFSVRFYMVAMLFILFDVEAVFMLPWAVIYRQLPTITGSPLLRLLGDDRLSRLRGGRLLLHHEEGHSRLGRRQGGSLAHAGRI